MKSAQEEHYRQRCACLPGRTETALVELRKLGKVREESQNSSDVTSQYVDLQARLTNARNTEQRLTDLLRERTGKLPEVVDVEREISRVREGIERMQSAAEGHEQQGSVCAERPYKSAVSRGIPRSDRATTPSAGTRLRNALIDGYHGAVVESVLNAALLVLLGWTVAAALVAGFFRSSCLHAASIACGWAMYVREITGHLILCAVTDRTYSGNGLASMTALVGVCVQLFLGHYTNSTCYCPRPPRWARGLWQGLAREQRRRFAALYTNDATMTAFCIMSFA